MSESAKAFFSGGFGGMCLVAVGHPLDTIKVRLQTSNEYKGMVDCFTKTVKNEGVGGLYKGMLAPFLGITPIFAVYFLGFDVGKDLARSFEKKGPDEQISTAGIMFAGGFSALPGTALMVPGDRAKVMLQIQGQTPGPPKYGGLADVFKGIVKEEGFIGLYKGAGLTLLRDGPGSMAYYGAYELLKVKLAGVEKRQLTPFEIIMAGGCAGCANWIVAVPPDVLKSRFQTAPAGTYPGGVKQVVQELLQKEGVRSLYKGLGPAMLRAFPANAACFLGMETSRKAMDKYF